MLGKLGERSDVAGSKILYVTAEGSREVLPEGLTSLGASVSLIHPYRSIRDGTGASRLKKALESGTVSAVTFTSASGVRAYVDLVGEEIALRAPAVSIGPQTSAAIEAAGIELLAEAEESTTDSLISAVERVFS